ncbi:MAG: protein kinase, partial [Myxococcales bacterium]|nr:protein kinase [Myxococcales bacterium]
AMELLEGKTLEQRLEGEPLGLEEALTILRRVARALDAAHAAGIAHRDLKPENVYLTYDEEGEVRPKLLDFGIAKLMHGGGELGRTAPGQVMGTPLFMAPEQWRGKKVGPQTDVFALGVLAYHMLSGDYPHRGEAPGDIMVKACMEPHRPIRDFRPDLSPAVDEAFAVILAKDAAERPATAKAAVELLQAALLDEDAALLDTQDGDVPPVPSSEAEEPAPAKEPASTKEPALPPISAEPASLAHERASKPPGIGSLGLRILIGIVLAIAALLYWFGAP